MLTDVQVNNNNSWTDVLVDNNNRWTDVQVNNNNTCGLMYVIDYPVLFRADFKSSAIMWN